MAEQANSKKRTWTEEIEVAGSELVGRIKGLVAEGNVRQLRIKAPGGELYFETPLTVGVIAGGAVALAAPWLAILGALAALVARVKLEIVREGESEGRSRPARRQTPRRGKSAARPAKRGRATRRPRKSKGGAGPQHST